jgi:hypothetical protein
MFKKIIYKMFWDTIRLIKLKFDYKWFFDIMDLIIVTRY